MTQPTQEDKILVAEKILRTPVFWKVGEGRGFFWKQEFVLLEFFDAYTDDSFTGALVKAVFPLLTEYDWVIQINNDGTIDICKFEEIDSNWSSRMVTSYLLVGMPNLNTALIEAWKKIEGEKR